MTLSDGDRERAEPGRNLAEEGSRSFPLLLALILLLGLALRFATTSQVFVKGQVYLDGPDGYYHLHRAAQTLASGMRVPQADPFLNAPRGGMISWPPLFDATLAALALPWSDAPRGMLERIGALLPPLLGLLQLLLIYALIKRVASRRAALISTFVAALLPGVVRYTSIGALDHDPFFETSVLLALLSIFSSSRRDPRKRDVFLFAAALSAGILGWTGAIVEVGIIGAGALLVVLLARQEAGRILRVIAPGSAIAAIVTLPFVLQSDWMHRTPFTFLGLSLLHTTSVIGLCFASAGLLLFLTPREERPTILLLTIGAAVPLLWLLPSSLHSFLTGYRYATGSADILPLVAEARPLLFLLGPFDLSPMLVRLGVLLVIPLVMLIGLKRRRDSFMAFSIAWIAVTATLAFQHSRFTYDLAVALSAASGMVYCFAVEEWPARRRSITLAACLTLVPIVPAYVAIPGLEQFHFRSRTNPLHADELDEICARLRPAERNGVVLAPWYLGHWFIWLAEKPVVMSPMLSVGQSEFKEAMGFYLLEEPEKIASFLQRHKVRYVVMTPELHSLAERARISGVDGRKFFRTDGTLEPRTYLRTIEARLTYLGTGRLRIGDDTLGAIPMHEVDRSRVEVPGAFGRPVPVIRVYEVNQPK